MEELERERAHARAKDTRDPEQVRALESLRLARTELERPARSDDARTAARADRAGDRRGRSPHERDECRERPIVRFTGTTTAPNTTSTASPARSGISTGRRSRVRFDRFAGAPRVALYPAPALAPTYTPRRRYDRLFGATSAPHRLARPSAICFVMRSGSRRGSSFSASRWSLRVNPSSGNLHPDRGLRRLRPAAGLAGHAGVYHYAADRHALELRCAFDADAWRAACGRRRHAARRR